MEILEKILEEIKQNNFIKILPMNKFKINNVNFETHHANIAFIEFNTILTYKEFKNLLIKNIYKYLEKIYNKKFAIDVINFFANGKNYEKGFIDTYNLLFFIIKLAFINQNKSYKNNINKIMHDAVLYYKNNTDNTSAIENLINYIIQLDKKEWEKWTKENFDNLLHNYQIIYNNLKELENLDKIDENKLSNSNNIDKLIESRLVSTAYNLNNYNDNDDFKNKIINALLPLDTNLATLFHFLYDYNNSTINYYMLPGEYVGAYDNIETSNLISNITRFIDVLMNNTTYTKSSSYNTQFMKTYEKENNKYFHNNDILDKTNIKLITHKLLDDFLFSLYTPKRKEKDINQNLVNSLDSLDLKNSLDLYGYSNYIQVNSFINILDDALDAFENNYLYDMYRNLVNYISHIYTFVDVIDNYVNADKMPYKDLSVLQQYLKDSKKVLVDNELFTTISTTSIIDNKNNAQSDKWVIEFNDKINSIGHVIDTGSKYYIDPNTQIKLGIDYTIDKSLIGTQGTFSYKINGIDNIDNVDNIDNNINNIDDIKLKAEEADNIKSFFQTFNLEIIKNIRNSNNRIIAWTPTYVKNYTHASKKAAENYYLNKYLKILEYLRNYQKYFKYNFYEIYVEKLYSKNVISNKKDYNAKKIIAKKLLLSDIQSIVNFNVKFNVNINFIKTNRILNDMVEFSTYNPMLYYNKMLYYNRPINISDINHIKNRYDNYDNYYDFYSKKYKNFKIGTYEFNFIILNIKNEVLKELFSNKYSIININNNNFNALLNYFEQRAAYKNVFKIILQVLSDVNINSEDSEDSVSLGSVNNVNSYGVNVHSSGGAINNTSYVSFSFKSSGSVGIGTSSPSVGSYGNDSNDRDKYSVMYDALIKNVILRKVTTDEDDVDSVYGADKRKTFIFDEASFFKPEVGEIEWLKKHIVTYDDLSYYNDFYNSFVHVIYNFGDFKALVPYTLINNLFIMEEVNKINSELNINNILYSQSTKTGTGGFEVTLAPNFMKFDFIRALFIIKHFIKPALIELKRLKLSGKNVIYGLSVSWLLKNVEDVIYEEILALEEFEIPDLKTIDNWLNKWLSGESGFSKLIAKWNNSFYKMVNGDNSKLLIDNDGLVNINLLIETLVFEITQGTDVYVNKIILSTLRNKNNDNVGGIDWVIEYLKIVGTDLIKDINNVS